MSNGLADPATSSRERLSALVDGELAAEPDVAAACAVWKDDAAMRATWHGYQLIGDVLRSEDLASEPARDAAFLQTLRERLAAEPVVLAPTPLETPAHGASTASGRRGRWTMPAAVAAGFVVVAGALLVTRAPTPSAVPDGAIAFDSRSSPAMNLGVPSLVNTASTSDGPEAPVVVLDLVTPRAAPFVTTNRILVRDPQLDRYLAAHKQFAGSTALGMPAGILRNASAEAPGR